jgi:hypothetical protein
MQQIQTSRLDLWLTYSAVMVDHGSVLKVGRFACGPRLLLQLEDSKVCLDTCLDRREESATLTADLVGGIISSVSCLPT